MPYNQYYQRQTWKIIGENKDYSHKLDNKWQIVKKMSMHAMKSVLLHNTKWLNQ